jgi:hypothetical protein
MAVVHSLPKQVSRGSSLGAGDAEPRPQTALLPDSLYARHRISRRLVCFHLYKPGFTSTRRLVGGEDPVVRPDTFPWAPPGAVQAKNARSDPLRLGNLAAQIEYFRYRLATFSPRGSDSRISNHPGEREAAFWGAISSRQD